jgi:hypothetical protein
MANMQLLDCCHPTQGALERVRYFPRQLLTADDMVTDQEYPREKMRRHNRYLHGWGTVCGLEVVAASTGDMPWRVKVTPGYALGPEGDEIYVGEPVHIDLARCGSGAVTDPCEPDLLHTGGSAIGPTLFLAVKYAECVAQPVRAMPAGCACGEEACEYSRIRDSFQIECLAELPPSHQPRPPEPLLCDLINGHRLPACPPRPAEPWVVLAQVTLPASPSTQVTDSSIDNITVRRQIYSTAVLQEQLIACCCKERPPQVPAKVIRVVPPDGAEFDTGEGNLPRPPSTIEIFFDKSLQGATVNGNTIRVVRSEDGGPALPWPGTVTYDEATRSARFTPQQPFGTPPPVLRRYTLTVFGDGADRILDADNLPLDGNGDGSPGGNFTSTFTVTHIIA